MICFRPNSNSFMANPTISFTGDSVGCTWQYGPTEEGIASVDAAAREMRLSVFHGEPQCECTSRHGRDRPIDTGDYDLGAYFVDALRRLN